MRHALLLGAMVAMAAAAWADAPPTGQTQVTFDGERAAAGWELSSGAAVDAARDRGGAGGGALKVPPGGKAVWKLRDDEGAGTVELWVHEDMTVPADPKKRRPGPRWGLVQKDGRALVVGAMYAPYLAGQQTYASSYYDRKTWFTVQYLGEFRRQKGWRRWTFTMDPKKGLSIALDGRDANARRRRFDWNRTGLTGFVGVAVFGDSERESGQTVWVDDVGVTLGGAMAAKPVPPPPPPPIVPEKDPPEAHPARLREAVKGKHPRLLFSAEDVPALRAFARGEGKAFFQQLEKYLPVCKAPDHTRFLRDGTDAQRQGYWRLPTAALHYVLTGREASLAAAIGFLRKFLALKHWEEGRERDSGMAAANIMAGAALAFDWLHADLAPALREAVRKKLLHHARAMYHGGHLRKNRSATAYWQNDPQNNHRWHRDAGLALCILAAYSGQSEADWILTRTFEELRFVHRWLPPDGTSHESPSYLIFGGSHLTLAMQAADRCFGTKYLDHPSFRNVALFRLHTLTPGLTDALPYGDGGGFGGYNNFLFKCAAHHRLADAQAGLARMCRLNPNAFDFAWFSLVWYDPALRGGSLGNVPKTAFYPDVGLALLRDGWEAGDVAGMLKCGPYGGWKLNQYRNENDFRYINVAHDDPDVNSFLLYAGGQLLAETSRYSKKKLTRSHNTILVNGRGQRGEGQGWTQPFKRGDKDMTKIAAVTAWKDAGDTVVVEGEGGGAYPDLTRYRRTFLWAKGRYVLILDDIRADRPAEIAWLIQSGQVRTLDEARGRYALEKGDARRPFVVASQPPVSASVAASTADHRGKPLGWRQLRLEAKAARLRVVSAYDLWQRGISAKLTTDGDKATVTVTGRDIEDTWTWQPPAEDSAPSRLTGRRGGKSFVEVTAKDRPPKH